MFYDKIIQIIDKDIRNNILSEDTKLLLSENTYYAYFFNELIRLADENWIPVLIENGLLTFDKKYGDFFLPLEYIRASLKENHKHDETIINLLFDWKEQLNDPTLSDFNVLRISEICTLLDNMYTPKVMDIMLWCLHLSDKSADVVISEFVPYVNKLKEIDADDDILTIFKTIFKFKYYEEKAFHSKEIKFVYDQYWVTEVFKEIKDVVQSNPLPYLKHLVNEYSGILKIIHPRKGDSDFNDYSNYARPAIEKSRYNLGVSTQDTIITMLRDIIDLVMDKEFSELILDYLIEQEYPIFRRLAVYLFGERYEILNSHYEEKFINSKMFSDYAVSHELWEVLRKRYSELKNKQKVNEIIEKGNPYLETDLSSEKVKREKWHWTYRWLSAVQKNSPTDKRSVRIKELEKKLGYEPGHPEIDVGWSETRTGWDSPISIEELSSMKWLKIKQYLLDFDEDKAKRTFSFQPEYEGLRRVFLEVIKRKHDDFLQHLDIFQDTELKKFYIGTIPEGILSGDDQYRKANLDKCFDYLSWVLDEVDKGNLDHDEKHIFKFYYGFRRFFDHFSYLNRNTTNKISEKDSEKYIELLARYYHLVYPHIYDPMELSEAEQAFINCPEGDYWQAWLNLNFLVYRYTEKPEIIKEFKKFLTEKIGHDIFVNYLVGRHTANFYFLDKKWTLSHIQDIFPPTQKKHKLWLATMKAFLWARSLLDDLFPYLLPNIKNFCNEKLDEKEQTSLGNRIAFYYLRDETHASCYRDLIKEISGCYEVNPTLFAAIIQALVRYYKEEENIDTRVRKYIRYRYNIIKKKPENYKEELEAIIYTYKCFPELGYRDYLIIRKAFEITDMNNRSLEIIELYKFFLNKKKYHYLIHLLKLELGKNTFPSYQKDEYSELFEALYRNGDKYVQRKTSELINYLGERGCYDYKDLYERYLEGEYPIEN